MTDLVELLVAYALGFAVAAVLWRGSRRVFEGYVFQRHNYRDHTLPTGIGILFPLVGATVIGAHVAVFDIWTSLGGTGAGWAVLATVGPATVELAAAFSFLGLIDDLGGVGESGGFRGHLTALFEGRITTGFIKMIGGPFFALAILSGYSPHAGRVGYLRDAALICLAANLANLFDRAPGRVNKVGQFAFAVLALATTNPRLVPIAIVMGAAGALLGADLREVFMLGDSGSNAIGAVLGFGVVVSTTEIQRWIVLAIVLVLNVGSEMVSFTKVIDTVGPLRRLDRWGAPHRRG